VLSQFNFVGKLLGPKGNSLKRLQEETLTKMAILGRGSMRDKHKVHTAQNPKQQLPYSFFVVCLFNGQLYKIPPPTTQQKERKKRKKTM
jgi:hypothetical protein